MQEMHLHEMDRRLIHALQVSPRAPWTDLAPVVGLNETTLARRWKALTESGLALTHGYAVGTPQHGSAIVEVDIEPGYVKQAVGRLSPIPAATTIDIVASGLSLVVTVGAATERELTEFLLEDLPSIPHVRQIRTQILTGVLRVADEWTIRELDESEVQSIPRAAGPRARAPRTVPAELEAVIVEVLGRDGRTSAAELARIARVPPQRVQDALAVLLHSGRFHLRTDLVNTLSGWPVHVWYFMDVEAVSLQDFARMVGGLPEIRFAATSGGSENLVVDVWLKNLAAIHQLEVAMQNALKRGVRLRRGVVLRTPKRLGHMMDRHGRWTGETVTRVAEAELRDRA
ncbi:Lrp/AsnC family transcriptional regulator [Citricoccus parietis]|uniref:Lrp/AsnC family transcriptional regulator n=1 Tax=Citricoccus parietis TaxID=592307 RepID=A0ABV6F0K9_9MICC